MVSEQKMVVKGPRPPIQNLLQINLVEELEKKAIPKQLFDMNPMNKTP